MVRRTWTVLLVTLLLFINAHNGKAMQAVGQGDNGNCPPVYTVQAGDTLRAIARRCGTTVSQLLFDNPLIGNAGLIYTGQILYLPAQASSQADAGPSEPVEEIPVTGAEQGVQAAGNDITNAADTNPAPAAEQPAGDSRQTYRVMPGDTLARIASQLETSLEVLMLANPKITNPNRIYVNQELVVPNQDELQALREARERQQAAQQQQVVETVGVDNAGWIDVDLANQKMRAYEGQELVQTFTVSTGTWRTPTVTGQYNIWIKLKADDMTGPGYFLRDVPNVMYFYKGYGLHGTYWHSNFGTPMSHGCVNLSVEDSAWLFDFAEVGTLVNVH